MPRESVFVLSKSRLLPKKEARASSPLGLASEIMPEEDLFAARCLPPASENLLNNGISAERKISLDRGRRCYY